MNARDALRASLEVHERIVAGDFAALVERAAAAMVDRVRAGGTIYWCGNGGSAADAQHLAAELVGKFYFDRPPVRSHAITTNSSTLTALVNDYPPEKVFERQVLAYVTDKDVFVGISTSGNSPNVLLATQAARERGAYTIAMTGETGGKLAPLAHLAIKVPSTVTPRIQEGHILLGHTICELVEHALFR
ncbi:MAG: D-sedoheptulose-7-phosphate isomerase [Myxococcota bacterium]